MLDDEGRGVRPHPQVLGAYGGAGVRTATSDRYRVGGREHRTARTVGRVAPSNRCRVYQDRLWDADGVAWSMTLGTWAAADEVAALLNAAGPVVVHGVGRAFSTLTRTEAAQFWVRAGPHFSVPGRCKASPDQEGLTFAAQTWARGQERLLGFVVLC